MPDVNNTVQVALERTRQTRTVQDKLSDCRGLLTQWTFVLLPHRRYSKLNKNHTQHFTHCIIVNNVMVWLDGPAQYVNVSRGQFAHEPWGREHCERGKRRSVP